MSTNSFSLNMDAFSDGQVASKLWLCEELERIFQDNTKIKNAWIYGSWYGTLALFLLTRARMKFESIFLFDIDSGALKISEKLLTHWKIQKSPHLEFHEHDCNRLFPGSISPDLIINTSVEHFENYAWWQEIPRGTYYVIQSTDMEHVEHINKVTSLQQLKANLKIEDGVLYEGTRHFSYPSLTFNRFMLIGKKL